MVRHTSNRTTVIAAAVLAFIVCAAFVTQATAQVCPRTCPGLTGKGSEAACPLMKSGNPTKFLNPYFEMRDLLARDEVAGTGALAKKLVRNAKDLRAEFKKAKASSDQLDALRKIESAASSFRATNLDVARTRFKSISTSVVKYVQGFGYDGSAYVYYCDMAKAAWVQETDKINNPYYGAKMPKCGTLVGQVVDGKYEAGSATPIKIEGKTM